MTPFRSPHAALFIFTKVASCRSSVGLVRNPTSTRIAGTFDQLKQVRSPLGTIPQGLGIEDQRRRSRGRDLPRTPRVDAQDPVHEHGRVRRAAERRLDDLAADA